MHLKSILLGLAAAMTTVSASSYFCPLALDKTAMIQSAYCCQGFKDAPHTNLSKVGVNCVDVNDHWVDECPKGGTPKCCYAIGPEIICTSEVGKADDDDDDE
ncbi:hypothetical protein P175DRAFT_0542857 [Aspergillus ochraceoroseus IBT 24754]|uniref:Hydrophobin n=1 Tax=Aspergillus ochraceoroseus IBT 24754 TaxID=1392256 RepID=A0A2T5M2T9_9EURO|nr:uncharacterized protein P175DRAFT_0542857 [Aspergillus ochraceoroseus IBT 24754]PTU22853.1 hypothetical protein P175DRAFT_0542857 [Aspergillus ochraceoroseus IBT 24754]